MDELYERGKTDPETNEYIAALNAQKIYPDPAAASAVADLRKKCPGKVREVVKNKDSIKNGIDRVRELFKANKLHIASTCIHTISELETYAYPDKKPDKNEYEDPIKENDHAMDALRYAIMMSVTGNSGQVAHQYRPAGGGPAPRPTQSIPGRAPQYRPRGL